MALLVPPPPPTAPTTTIARSASTDTHGLHGVYAYSKAAGPMGGATHTPTRQRDSGPCPGKAAPLVIIWGFLLLRSVLHVCISAWCVCIAVRLAGN